LSLSSIDELIQIYGSIMKPRRVQILKILMEKGQADINELKNILNIPLSSIYYDIEVLKNNGLIIKESTRVIITEKGRQIIDTLLRLNSQTHIHKKLELTINLLLLRPLIMPLVQLDSKILALFTLIITALSLTLSQILNLRLILITYVTSLTIPHVVTYISLPAYIGLLLCIYRLCGGVFISNVRLLTLLTSSLIPILTYPSIFGIVTQMLSLELSSVILLEVVKILLAVLSIVYSATVISVSTGKPIELIFMLETLLILVPGIVMYSIIISYV